MWLRTTDFGDDKDRVLVKSDGEPTYLLPDIAYHRDKFARGFDLLIDVWGADHHGYVAADEGRRCRRSATTRTSSRSSLGQLVTLVRDGEPVRLSKRAGDIVELRDLLDEVGPDVGPAHVPAAVDRHPPDLRPRRGHAPGRWTTRSSTCRWPTPASARSSGVAAERGVDRVAARRRRPRAARRTSASSRCCARCPSCPTSSRWPCDERAPHKVTTWVRELAGAVPRLLPRLLRDGRRRRRRADPGPAVAGRGGRDRPRHRARPARRVGAPESM